MKTNTPPQDPFARARWNNQILAVALFCLPVAVACQPWVALNDIGTTVTGSSSASPPVTEALSLSLNNKIYVIGSRNFTGNTPSAYLWEYNTVSDSWTEKSVYPGNGRSWHCGFTIGNHLYIGCGTSGSEHACSDFYKYNPATNTWSAIANIPVGRLWATGFSIGGKGYVTGGEGTTMSQYLGDFWAYDTTLNTWTPKASFPGPARALPIGFANKTAGFVGLGFASNVWLNDLYKYMPATDTWTAVSPLPAQGRGATAVATIGDFAIAVCGNSMMTVFNDCYAYNTINDSWAMLSSFGGVARTSAICGSAGNKIFAGGGSTSGGMVFLRDWWTMGTTVSIGETDVRNITASVGRNRDGRYFLSVKDPNVSATRYCVYELTGRLVCSGHPEAESGLLPELRPGIYTISFPGSQVPTIRFVAE